MEPGVAVPLLGAFLLLVGVIVYKLPCHHGKDCMVCKEEARTRAIKAEADAERQRQLHAEYERKAGFRIHCDTCGDNHAPHNGE